MIGDELINKFILLKEKEIRIKMKNIKKLGYISIELVIVAGVVLAFGLIGVMKFVKQGKQASQEQSDALKDVYDNMKLLRQYNESSNPTTD